MHTQKRTCERILEFKPLPKEKKIIVKSIGTYLMYTLLSKVFTEGSIRTLDPLRAKIKK